ncbi:MAG: assimilatory sulfite reductase (NADPH) flavoprotein subunit [Dokdonella sp.]|uniref:assimilatory sulfite reductase (NADPH) flavoprotein subunit n=1 Tax=Dokdonella sp. TaxID=2291710 RepID=UPI0032648167
MPALPAPSFAPLPGDASADILRLLEGLDAPTLWWVSGYAAALAHSAGPPRTVALLPQRDAGAQERVTIIYGSQTGNARRVAERLAQAVERAGLAVRLIRADAYPQRELKTERLLYIVISTQGEGDPPDDARGLVDFIAGKRAPTLPDLKFAVLGLGDSSYPLFCAIGRRLDARLVELGAQRMVAAGEADVDVETIAEPWIDAALAQARDALTTALPRANVTPLHPHAAPAEWSRENPFAAELLVNQRITARDSSRAVHHFELSLEGSGLTYEPGDALGVWPTNASALVDSVIQALRLDGDEPVACAGETHSVRTWLGSRRELTKLSRPFIAAHAARSRADDLNRLLAPDRSTDLAGLLASHQVIDLLHAFPAAWTAGELVAALRPLAPRLYSIASSRKAVGDEVHLTVADIGWDAFGISHAGAASSFLASRGDGARVPVFVEPNERFRVPADGSTDVIMIGPGTGVAPFRGFVQERRETAARGRNWLLFGNRHSQSDFLYQTEWQAALRDGSLHRLDLAFSRDEAIAQIPRTRKTYVQDRLRENGRSLFEWLDNGAHLYVCGDATRMAKDVHAALVDVFSTHGGLDGESAEARLSDLIQQGRYARDVY